VTGTASSYRGSADDTPAKAKRILDYFRRGTAELDSALLKNVVTEERALTITVKEALRTRGAEAEKVIMQELSQMMDRRVWTVVKLSDLSTRQKMDIIRSSMFLKMKVLAVVDIGGAFLNADMDTGILVHMRLDATMSGLLCRLDQGYIAYMDTKGCIVVRLDKALYGCVESAALWYDNLSQSMQDLGYSSNKYESCVFNRLDERGTQCTATVHVDDLFISSKSPSMIEHLCTGLKDRYGDITRKDGPVVSYLGMTFDLSFPGEARLTIRGYVEELLISSGVIGKTKTPATDDLFELRESAPMLTPSQAKWFHRHVARVAYVAKRAKPECLPAVAFLSTRASRRALRSAVLWM
jgi:Reverse transcriptase (RNA-dependent DNA polymerase)